jgi:chromate transporter
LADVAVTRDDAVLWTLAANFAGLSFFAVGGINALLPEIHRVVVDNHAWMTSARFAELFAIANAAPGPNFTVVTLIGWQTAGISGALVSTFATVLPTSILTYAVGSLWTRFGTSRWRPALQGGLVPVTIGLVAASALLLARTVDTSIPALAITLLSAVCLYATRLNPLVFLGAGAALGLLGFI